MVANPFLVLVNLITIVSYFIWIQSLQNLITIAFNPYICRMK